MDGVTECVRFAWSLRSDGYSNDEILEALRARWPERSFQDESIRRYLHEGRKRAQTEIKESVVDESIFVRGHLNKLIKKWLPMATAEVLHVKERRIINGKSVEIVDADDNRVQREASKVLLEVIKQKCKVEGIGADAKAEEGEGKVSQQLIMQTVNQLFIQNPGVADMRTMGGLVLGVDSE